MHEITLCIVNTRELYRECVNIARRYLPETRLRLWSAIVCEYTMCEGASFRKDYSFEDCITAVGELEEYYADYVKEIDHG